MTKFQLHKGKAVNIHTDQGDLNIEVCQSDSGELELTVDTDEHLHLVGIDDDQGETNEKTPKEVIHPYYYSMWAGLNGLWQRWTFPYQPVTDLTSTPRAGFFVPVSWGLFLVRK